MRYVPIDHGMKNDRSAAAARNLYQNIARALIIREAEEILRSFTLIMLYHLTGSINKKRNGLCSMLIMFLLKIHICTVQAAGCS